MKIKIQKAVPDDAVGMRYVLHETWLATYPNENYRITREDIEYNHRDYFTDKSIAEFKNRLRDIASTDLRLVAKDEDNGNKIVAVSLMRKYERHNRLEMLYVLPEYQGKGIGMLLWNELLKVCDPQKDIVLNVAVYNEKAISFYKKCGFRDTGKRIEEERFKMRNGSSIPEMEMRLIHIPRL